MSQLSSSIGAPELLVHKLNVEFGGTRDKKAREPKEANKVSVVPVEVDSDPLKESLVTFYSEQYCNGETLELRPGQMSTSCKGGSKACQSLCELSFPGKSKTFNIGGAFKSIRVKGKYELDLFGDCGLTQYWSSVFELDGCTNIYTWPNTAGIAFSPTPTLDMHRESKSGSNNGAPNKFRIVYSGESSTYFGYQAQASYFSFLESRQTGGSWTRLMTSQKGDDMMDTFPTFNAKRHPYSRRYGPLNKADVLTKWFASADTPRDEVLVVVDPDNWMLKDIRPWVDNVKPGQAVAQRAWFSFQRSTITTLWKEFCQKNCDWHLDLAAVPYFVHRDDLAVISPLWKMYSLAIKERVEREPKLERQFGGIQIGWGAEMFGYIFGAAHAGIRHEIVDQLQLRDVDPRVSPSVSEKVPFIHMGRIWFPHNVGCGKYCHTEGKAFSGFGDQVWCKCNVTASDVIPWPMPDGMDFVSFHTLRILHGGREKFGPIAADYSLRPKDYHAALP